MDAELIYDVGAHVGEDTAHYLSLGYRVIAIEADPVLAKELGERFAGEIAAKQLTVLNVGVHERDGQAIPFYTCSRLPLWNSFDKSSVERAGFEVIEVPITCRRFDSILAEYGVPRFLKVDIEGADHLCLLALSKDDLPEFVSFEAQRNSLSMILWLHNLGFRRFGLVDQNGFHPVSVPEPGSIGSVKWALEQMSRSYVRAHPQLQRAVGKVRSAMARVSHRALTGASAQPKAAFSIRSSGPAPMNRPATDWQDIESFLHTWIAVVKSGVLSSSWYDIHVSRDAVPTSVHGNED